MDQSRRSFVRVGTLSAGAVAPALAIDSLQFFFPTGKTRTIEAMAADVFIRQTKSGLFVANAAPGPWLVLLRVLGAAASICDNSGLDEHPAKLGTAARLQQRRRLHQ